MAGKPVALILSLLIIATAIPAGAWYYFTATNGRRTQWVFDAAPNNNSRPINIYVDSDTPTAPANLQDLISTEILPDWNGPLTNPIFSTALVTGTTMTSSAVNAYLSNPEPNRIWIVHDTDGSILASLGLTSTSILGLGLSLTSSSEPHKIYSGIVIINASVIASSSDGNSIIDTVAEQNLYQGTVLHELGHILGLAHSVGGGYNQTIVNTGYNHANLPVMYPFWYSDKPFADLLEDDKAAVRALYYP
jgi:hypothetical protein